MEVIITSGQKTQHFITIFHHLKTKINDINLIFSAEKLYLQGMDGSQIGLFELALTKAWFKKYTVTQSVTLGVNCELLFKMLNCIEKTQDIILQFSNDGDDIKIILKSEEKGIFDKQFCLPLIDIDVDLMHIPPTEYSVDLKVQALIFDKIINQLSIFAGTVKVICSEIKVLLQTTKDSAIEQGDMNVKIGYEDMLEYAIEEDLVLELTFSLSYLTWMLQFSRLTTELYVHFKKELPMKIRYELDDESFIQFFLAPQYDDF